MDFETEIEIFNTAEAHFNDNRYAQAEPLLNQLVLKNVKRAEVFHMLGTIYYDQGKFNKAIRSFQRALEINPRFTDSSIGLSIILNDLGRYDEGQKVFDEAKALLSVQGQGKDSALDERFASKHDELGEMYLQHNRANEALEQFTKAYELTNLRRPEIGVSMSECYVLLNQVPQAIKTLKGLTREYPHFVPARLKLGKCFYDLHQIPEAIEQWEAALRSDPGNSTARDFLRLAQAVHVTTLNAPDMEL